MTRPIIDLTGQRFGKLTVISISDYRSSYNTSAYWDCICDCGEIKAFNSQNLRYGNTKSCGCYQKEQVTKARTLPNKRAAINALFGLYKYDAKRRSLCFNINLEDFIKLINQNCFYCNVSPNSVRKTKNVSGQLMYNGLDRVDNTKGYTLDNVVTCCKTCNYAKQTMTQQDFLDWIKRVYENAKTVSRI